MKCPICKHGDTIPGTASVTLERGGMTLVFKNVPGRICDNCGEAFHDEEVTRALLAQAEVAAAAGVQFDVRGYPQAA